MAIRFDQVIKVLRLRSMPLAFSSPSCRYHDKWAPKRMKIIFAKNPLFIVV